jgi:hypothetical protein
MGASTQFHSVLAANLPSSGTVGDVWYTTDRKLIFAMVGDGSLVQLLVSTPIPVVGATGPTGPPGPQGAQGPALFFQGNWQSASEYVQGSMVTYNGNLWLANQTSIGNTPASNPFWTLLGPLPSQTSEICFAIDGGGVAPSPGFKGYVTIPYAAKITGWNLLSDQPLSAVFDVKWSTYANVPATVSNVGGSGPALVAAQKAQGGVSAWTKTAFNSGDLLEIDIVSASTILLATLTLLITSTN